NSPSNCPEGKHLLQPPGDGPMSAFRIAASALPIMLAAALALPAFAQQSPAPAAPGPAAPKPATAKPASPKPKPATPSPAAAAATGGDVQPTLLGQYGDWGAYTAAPSGKKICFALAKPKSSKTEPP